MNDPLTEKVIDFYFFDRILAAQRAYKSSTWTNKVFKSAFLKLNSEVISFENMPCEGKCLPFPRKLPFFVMQRKIWKEFGSSALVHRATKVAYTYIKGFYFRNHVFLQIVKTYFRFRYLYRLSRAPSRLNTTWATKVSYIKESPHTETFTARFQDFSKIIFAQCRVL